MQGHPPDLTVVFLVPVGAQSDQSVHAVTRSLTRAMFNNPHPPFSTGQKEAILTCVRMVKVAHVPTLEELRRHEETVQRI
ncbi:hypothetical protein CTheo_6502 [Ceratobasidium theobromae]|uniref:Uncharacterized protein n=1 Tax=Ceratobasidium theobromae TaxID=1582974 RepID=A0A5N5QE78_9AGAM|nr:hypothetical protein CTheo_6502 [Ceratobasidium theobromae]